MQKKAEDKALAEAETEVLADGTIAFLSPRYKYYEFSGPLATNLINSRKILTINISVAVFETPMKAEDFYEVHKERPFFGELCKFMSSGPIVVQVLEGENAINKNREIESEITFFP